MGDTIKANKSSTARRRRLKKDSVVEDENMEVMDFGEGEDVDLDVAIAIEKIRKEVCVEQRTMSLTLKSRSSAGIKQKHIIIKRKRKVSK